MSDLDKWFYPHAKQVAEAMGIPQTFHRVPLLVEDAWNYQEKKLQTARRNEQKMREAMLAAIAARGADNDADIKSYPIVKPLIEALDSLEDWE